MARDLRDRIAEAICGATTAGKMFPWSTLNEREKDSWRAMADAVISELKLKRTDGPLKSTPVHRYITDWIPNG